jgi:hypothetical protein
LRIADLIAVPPGGRAERFPEVARVVDEQISVEVWETYRR